MVRAVRAVQLAFAGSLLLGSAMADIPSLPNYRVVWADDFDGGPSVDKSAWDQVSRWHNQNGEIEHYTDSTDNAYLANGELSIVPIKSGDSWTSARIESWGNWKCPPGRALVVQAEISIPDFESRREETRGIWPAFWALGQNIRGGVPWPKSGEWDILESNNKLGRAQGTLHFAQPGGPDENGNYRDNSHFWQQTDFGAGYHTWALKIDRRNDDWWYQKLTWYIDGREFHSVTGSAINNYEQWTEIAHSPYFIILNVAVGGEFSGYPGPDTLSGEASALKARYVAVYEST
ncbi:concanavalin A-like lectin/glucanase domain-containing protein [Podospora didyma]|uniref:Concanavalin A-like lectin/glucanase domain-containing protein n=1 Tax=Podospora didyma TaxID=330526 RepID=A0AAE0K396_9PEZI|nr:concanavalin A-like lectin/glucanase domain-containing protein [Podospora didyma]